MFKYILAACLLATPALSQGSGSVADVDLMSALQVCKAHSHQEGTGHVSTWKTVYDAGFESCVDIAAEMDKRNSAQSKEAAKAYIQSLTKKLTPQ